MSADDGMDAVDWRARAEAAERKLAQAEHSIRVLRDHVETLRGRMDDRLTVWDHYASAALRLPAEEFGGVGVEAADAARVADAMMAERARRSQA